MAVSSINGHIHPPKDSVLVRADVRQGWFVISYDVDGRRAEFFYNQDGREVFRVDYPKTNTYWQRFKRYFFDR